MGEFSRGYEGISVKLQPVCGKLLIKPEELNQKSGLLHRVNTLRMRGGVHVGLVLAVANDVEDIEIGDRVMIEGSYAGTVVTGSINRVIHEDLVMAIVGPGVEVE